MMKRNGKFKDWMVILPGMIAVFLSLSLTKGSLAGSPSMPQATSSGSPPAGEAAKGRDLFMGSAHFANDAPPCMACHNVDSDGLLGGGVLGPDLTDVSSRYDDTALAQFLDNPPGPVMKPIYTEHPLTAQEQADLVAFLESSAGQPASDKEPVILSISLAGLIAAAGLFGFLYRKRLRGVRKLLVKGAQSDGQGN
jgi:cytochrome c2